jgi:hypothetical protein
MFIGSKRITLAFSCGARSAFKLKGKGLLEKHAIARSAAGLVRFAVLPAPHLSEELSYKRKYAS